MERFLGRVGLEVREEGPWSPVSQLRPHSELKTKGKTREG